MTLRIPTGSGLILADMAMTPRDAEHLRRLRNECREWMTGSQAYITEEDQAVWWATRNPLYTIVWLYREPRHDAPDPIAFGMVRKEGSYWYGTLGVTENRRGRGYGREIYRHLIEVCPGSELRIDILMTNRASLRAAEYATFIDITNFEDLARGVRRLFATTGGRR